MSSLQSFDLLGALPTTASTTVLEASAGTGKTYALAGLVTRFVAEGAARLDEMLLITFGRAASQELRERVRDQLVAAARVLDDPSDPARAGDDELLRHLANGTEAELTERRHRVRDALAGFDAATIATTHQFCRLVLASLGVAGDSDSGVTLVESLDELVAEVVDDLYLRRFGHDRDAPVLTRDAALVLAREVVANPHTTLTPEEPEPGTTAAVRVGFARDVLTELERRKRRLGVLGYDDLLTRLAAALAVPDSPAADRMRRRWRVVMVDEFQDTDPVQWQVVEHAFVGHATVVLIGDPKQAIYAFRGGDIATYLRAREAATSRQTLDTNRRSDKPLVDRLQVVMRGAALGHEDIVVRPIEAHRQEHRLAGGPQTHPFRLRVVTREKFGLSGTRTIQMDVAREHIARDLAADIRRLLAGDATYDGRPVGAGDIAVIVEAHRDARVCRDALADAGIPAVYTGDTDVFASVAAGDWLRLLEAFEQPHRSGLVRAAATTMFFGETAQSIAEGGDELTDRIADTLRVWSDHARERGLAAVFEAAQVAGLGRRILGWQGGERHLTDLAHVAQVLHETAQRERLGQPAILDWLRVQCSDKRRTTERNRRLDSDAAAVQVMTVWVSKGLQYPIVYLPFAFNRNIPERDNLLFHRDLVTAGERCLDIGGKGRAGFREIEALARSEVAGDDIRLTYVALTRAQSQVVAWWAPTWDEPNGGLSRLLRGRVRDAAAVPDRCEPKVTDLEALAVFRRWEAEGGPVVEESAVLGADAPLAVASPQGLGVRRFARPIDVTWTRTSYSGLVRAAEPSIGTSSEPEDTPLDDEATDLALGEPSADAATGSSSADGDLVSPMTDLPSSATFGSLVHAVLEGADPHAGDLLAELTRHVTDQLPWWPVDASADAIAEALVPLHHTPLGPFAAGLTLGDIGFGDRLRELDFEIPLAGGDVRSGTDVTLADVGRLLVTHLDAADPFRAYADRLLEPGLGDQPLRGYLTGSIDVVLRVPDPDQRGDSRYLVVDYKTNHLGEQGQPLTTAHYSPDRMVESMLHSDYPLQALLYAAVVHRYLRWRQPGYDPARHLAGVLYLYLRGMCGPDTPLTDGHPAGVLGWRPPAALVVALSDLLDGRLAT
ncbi:UvrD-helicase domain-containing protein [Nocardioides bigeumensis]|uniref:UvrD-helicase domain-containing protein n=1 Tax=Nocardioides bigeumensis TaxID=433657 RepID=UPI0031CDFE7A